MDIMDFSRMEPRSMRVIGPDQVKYLLREASADAAVKYRNANASAAVWEGDKIIRIGTIADCEPVLVGNCLYKTDGDKYDLLLVNGLPVVLGEDTVRTWPEPVMSQMFDWIKENSPGLFKKQKGAEADPKKSPASGETTSS